MSVSGRIVEYRHSFGPVAIASWLGVTVQPGPVFGRATPLFGIGAYYPYVATGVDDETAPDGRFLMIKRQDPAMRQ